MENITSTIISLSTLVTALGALIIAIIKMKKEIENTLPKKVKNQCDIDVEIMNKLEDTKEILNADRIQIYDFHNGRALC